MQDEELLRRKNLTFCQAEGIYPLPQPLSLGELSDELRALLWAAVYDDISAEMRSAGRKYGLGPSWEEVLRGWHVQVGFAMADEFDTKAQAQFDYLKAIFRKGEYFLVLELVQFVLRTGQRPALWQAVDKALVKGGAAYGLIDRDTIVPLVTPEEGNTLLVALENLKSEQFLGAYSHLKNAAELLGRGEWAPSIRESISTVESVARKWEPSATTLDPALKKLGKTHRLHPALIKGFGSLYGFTSDEEGIRHPLLEMDAAAVDQTDAVFMLGSCAAFTTYLLRRYREAV